MIKEIVLATFNEKKFQEIKRILSKFLPDVNFLNLNQFPQIEKIKEDGKSFEENALRKARGYYQQVKKITLAEDSGLEVKALQGKPGIYSSRFAGEDANDHLNNLKLLNLLKDIPWEERKAQFVSVVAIVNENEIHIFKGKLKGKISFEMKGKSGFGYDPVFIPDGYQNTLAELGPEIKDRISHRFQALKLSGEYLKKL